MEYSTGRYVEVGAYLRVLIGLFWHQPLCCHGFLRFTLFYVGIRDSVILKVRATINHLIIDEIGLYSLNLSH
jgi:hypothetical protein